MNGQESKALILMGPNVPLNTSCGVRNSAAFSSHFIYIHKNRKREYDHCEVCRHLDRFIKCKEWCISDTVNAILLSLFGGNNVNGIITLEYFAQPQKLLTKS